MLRELSSFAEACTTFIVKTIEPTEHTLADVVHGGCHIAMHVEREPGRTSAGIGAELVTGTE